MLNKSKSSLHFQRAKHLIPDGVSSPMRSFYQVGNSPIAISSASGSTITDIDGNTYTDFLCGFGALFLGHGRQKISAAVVKQLNKGMVYGLSTELEYQLAEKIVTSTPSIDKIRFVCSGSEAVMTALRIARAHTQKKLLIKFVGAYHGHADTLLASPNLSDTINSKGATSGIIDHNVIHCEYNNIKQLEDIFTQYHKDIAAVIVEPIATNMGFVKPHKHFHPRIRELCSQFGALFIFDEVVTGFRFTYGGISKLWGLDPDLTTFGKIIGGGASIGAYAGKSQYMSYVETGNSVFQSGTFSANPIAMAAGNAALDILAAPGFYENMNHKGAYLELSIKKYFAEKNIPFYFSRLGSLSGISYRYENTAMRSYRDVKKQLYNVYRDVHLLMQEKGILMAPSLEEPIFLSAAHNDKDIEYFAKHLAQSIATVLEKNAINIPEEAL